MKEYATHVTPDDEGFAMGHFVDGTAESIPGLLAPETMIAEPPPAALSAKQKAKAKAEPKKAKAKAEPKAGGKAKAKATSTAVKRKATHIASDHEDPGGSLIGDDADAEESKEGGRDAPHEGEDEHIEEEGEEEQAVSDSEVEQEVEQEDAPPYASPRRRYTSWLNPIWFKLWLSVIRYTSPLRAPLSIYPAVRPSIHSPMYIFVYL